MGYGVYLFDFDYTLADAEAAILKCYRTVILRHGYPDVPDELIKRGIGKGITEIFRMLTGIEDNILLERYSVDYIREADGYMTDNTFLYPQVIPSLSKLKQRGNKLGIVSNKLSRRLMEALVKYDIVDLFDVIIGSEDMDELKPSPAGIYAAMERLGAEKEEVLYVGDSLVDAETAQNAGVAFAAVTTGVTSADEFGCMPNTIVIKDLSMLPGLE